MPVQLRPSVLLTIAALLSAGALTWPAWPAISSVWFDDGTYSHGLLLIAVCGWLIWRDMRRQGWPEARTDWRWLIPLLIIAVLFQLSSIAALDLPQRLLLVPLLLCLAGTLGGNAWFRRLCFPLLLLSLAIPMWGLLVAPLQALAVLVVSSLLALIDIPASIDNTHIRIAAGTFAVSQGCSGLRYLLVAAAITLLWGQLYLRDLRTTLLYVLIGTAFALVSNWLRIAGLILVGHYTDMQHPLMEDHNNFGWYIFAAALLPLFWIGRQLPHRDQGPLAPAESTSAVTHPATALIAVAVLVLPIIFIKAQPDMRLLHAPLPADGWQAVRPQHGDWQPSMTSADLTWNLAYQNVGGEKIRLHLYWYGHQRPGAELLAADNALLVNGWTGIQVPSPCPLPWRCMQIRNGRSERVVMYSYLVNGRLVSSPVMVKLQQLLAGLSGRSGAALIALDSDCNDSCIGSLVALPEQAGSLLNDLLGQLGNGASP
ncbi:MAG TPA: EpsI family protein [Pseudomonadales bacterium]